MAGDLERLGRATRLIHNDPNSHRRVLPTFRSRERRAKLRLSHQWWGDLPLSASEARFH